MKKRSKNKWHSQQEKQLACQKGVSWGNKPPTQQPFTPPQSLLKKLVGFFDLKVVLESSKLCIEDFDGRPNWEVFHGGNEEDHYALYTHPEGDGTLAVAHMDSVQGAEWVSPIINHPSGDIFFFPQADDRMGVYTVTELLPKMGIKSDILLTDNEERGQTTAADFIRDLPNTTDHKWNWMYSFDRTGHDVAMYSYMNSECDRDLKAVGMESAHGSFSCIKAMDSLGIKGYNWGTAYHNYHGEWAYVRLAEYLDNVAKFTIFHQQHHAMKRPHFVKPAFSSTYSTRGNSPTVYAANQGYLFGDHPIRTRTPFTPLTVRGGKGRQHVSPEDTHMCIPCERYYRLEELDFDMSEGWQTSNMDLCPHCFNIATSLYSDDSVAAMCKKTGGA